ncbi:DUF4258 domain-containing protein [Patescibacteria group bacterium]|nr:DUF4258 domain-containing protein [Patescibacteria group bacterium]
MNNIVFTDHAYYQMKERKISEKSIIAALNNPDRIKSQTNQRKQLIKLFQRNKRKYFLVVIYEENRQVKKVVTVFVTSKIKKYF